MTDASIRFERRTGDIAWLRFDRPRARNAMSAQMWESFGSSIATVAADSRIRVLVLCGNEDAFVSGADIGDFRTMRGPQDGVAYERGVERTLKALENLDAVTIAAVSGACTGGGAILAAACDLRIGTAGARVGVPIARTVGNITTADNVARLMAVVGRARTLAWILTAQLSDAAAAERFGFFSEIVPDFASLLERADELSRSIAGNAPLTIAAAKDIARRFAAVAAGVDDRDLLERCYGSDDFREGVAAFLEKRPARFVGR